MVFEWWGQNLTQHESIVSFCLVTAAQAAGGVTVCVCVCGGTLLPGVDH